MSYRDINLHLVWAVKERRRLLPPETMDRLCKYLAGAIRNMNGEVYAIDGPADHLHAAISLPPDIAVADLVRDLKSNSSRWLHDTMADMKSFAWQDGYSAFSVSRSVLPNVIRYVESQKQHHKALSYEDELKQLLDKHGIRYDPQYI